jgi:hypothetical protein
VIANGYSHCYCSAASANDTSIANTCILVTLLLPLLLLRKSSLLLLLLVLLCSVIVCWSKYMCVLLHDANVDKSHCASGRCYCCCYSFHHFLGCLSFGLLNSIVTVCICTSVVGSQAVSKHAMSEQLEVHIAAICLLYITIDCR